MTHPPMTVREAVLGIESDEGPVCPWCRTLHEADKYVGSGSCLRKCSKCKRKFMFACITTRTWVSRPPEETP